MNNPKQPIFESAEEAYDFAFRNQCKLDLNDEILIATKPNLSYWYAKNILKEKFELGEKIISTSSVYSFLYATEVLKSRFKQGEKTIAEDCLSGSKHLNLCNIYINYFKNEDLTDILKFFSIESLEKFFTHEHELEVTSKYKDTIIKELFKKKVLNQ